MYNMKINCFAMLKIKFFVFTGLILILSSCNSRKSFNFPGTELEMSIEIPSNWTIEERDKHNAVYLYQKKDDGYKMLIDKEIEKPIHDKDLFQSYLEGLLDTRFDYKILDFYSTDDFSYYTYKSTVKDGIEFDMTYKPYSLNDVYFGIYKKHENFYFRFSGKLNISDKADFNDYIEIVKSLEFH